jgi:hypothetical protein
LVLAAKPRRRWANIGRLSQTHAVPFAAVPARPTRSVEAAARWQDRLDRLVLVSAATAVAGVALQTLEKSGPLHIVGLIAGAVGWLIFGVDAAIMLAVSPEPRRWARRHALELVLLVVTCPLWPWLFYRLLVLELTPSLTVLDTAKLAKLVKVARAVQQRGSGRLAGRIAAIAIILAAIAVAIFLVHV